MGRMARIDYVYGIYYVHGCFAVWDEHLARQTADEIAAVKACSTLGELRALAPTLAHVPSPVDFDDVEDEPDETPWRWQDEGSVCDGDWPEMPTQRTFSMLGKPLMEEVLAATGGSVIETNFNGPYADIPAAGESQLVAVLTKYGTARRDDALIDSLGS